MLEAVDLRRSDRWVLRDLNLRLANGRRYALLGENGAGKTQFLKLLSTDVWPTPTGRESLRFEARGRRLDTAQVKRRIAYLGAERQDKYARYGWNPRVRELLATGLHGTDLLLRPPTADERRRVERTLRRYGIARLAERPFLALSYGQKRVALLARALIRETDWLLLDEIYNGLDETYRRRVDRMLERVRRDGRSWVAAAHRAEDLPRGTTELLRLHAGRLERCGPLRRRDALALAPAAAGRTGAAVVAGAAAAGRAAAPALRAAARSAARGQALVRLHDVDLYVDYRCVLRGIDWQLRRGEHWAVLGANGSGKTSFLKLLYGDLAPAHGGLILRAGCARGTAIDRWKRRVGYVSPELQTEYDFHVRLVDVVASGASASIGLVEPASAARRLAARRWLEWVGLAAEADRRPRELSYGQMRRALLARALAHEPELLLLDEPFTGLDPHERARLKRHLDALGRAGTTMVIAVHHPQDLPDCVTRQLRLRSRRAHPANTMPRR